MDVKRVLETVDEDNTVKLVIKRDQNEYPQDAIDLMAIAENMWRKRVVYIWAILGLFFLGCSVALLKRQMDLKKTGDEVKAIFSLDYEGGAELLAPNGESLNLELISSPYVINKALNNTQLTEELSPEAVSSALTVERMLSNTTKQHLEVIAVTIEKDQANAQNALDVEYVYTNKILLTLKNGFDEGVRLPKQELTNLLNNIVDAYSDYLFEQYAEFAVPSNSLTNLDVSTLDYAQALELMDYELSELKHFCTTGILQNYMSYRYSKNGMQLGDVIQLINYLQSNEIAYLNAYVYEQGLTNNPERTLAMYDYELRNLGFEYEAILRNIESNADSIANYKNDNNTLMNQSGTSLSIGATVTDHYNALILKQRNALAQKLEMQKKMKNIQDRVSLMKENTQGLSGTGVEAEISLLHSRCLVLYRLVEEITNELLENPSYQKSFLFILPAQYEQKPFFSSEMVSSTVKFGLIGCFLAFLLWGLDATLEELKKGQSVPVNGGEQDEEN